MADKQFAISVSGTDGKTTDDIAAALRAAADGIANHIVNSEPKGRSQTQTAFLDNINLNVNTGDITIDAGALGSAIGLG